MHKLKSILVTLTFVLLVTFPAQSASDIYIAEDFSSAPAVRGWGVHGVPNLFQWNSTNQNVEVTWDSAQPTSYFYLPLGTTITTTNDFMFGFDLRLSDIAAGVAPGYPYSAQIAIALLNFANATNSMYSHAEGYFPNVVEFAYYPYVGGPYGGGPYATAISSSVNWSTGGFTEWLVLDTGVLHHVELRFLAAEHRLTISIKRDGQSMGLLKEARLPSTFGDFQLDTLAVASYNHTVPWPDGGSVLAHGTLDNVFFINPPPMDYQGGAISSNAWETRVSTRTGWNYQLQRSVNLRNWVNAGDSVTGTGSERILKDPEPLTSGGFYRVQANRP